MEEARRRKLAGDHTLKCQGLSIRKEARDVLREGWGSYVCPFCHMLIEYGDCGELECVFPNSECCREWCEDQGWNIILGHDRSCPRGKDRK